MKSVESIKKYRKAQILSRKVASADTLPRRKIEKKACRHQVKQAFDRKKDQFVSWRVASY